MKFAPKIIQSIINDQVSLFQDLVIKQGGNLIATDEGGYSLLHWSAQEGSENICRWLLGQAPELLKVADTDGQQPLRIASGEGHETIVKLFLDLGAETESENDYHTGSSLEIALLYKHIEVAKILIMAGANYMKINDENKSAKDYAVNLGNKEILEMMGGFNPELQRPC